MKHSLLLVAVVAALALAGPAYSQYMYLDVDGNGICDTNDVLTPSTSSVDIWVTTDKNENGTTATCNTGPEALTINSYEFFLRATGAVTYGAWTDNMGFGTSFGDFDSGPDCYHGRGSGTASAPGNYKLGSLAISGVASGATLSIVSSSTVNPSGFTSFGTQCFGSDSDGTYKLPTDWTDVCGTASPTPVTRTTWGTIKDIYR